MTDKVLFEHDRIILSHYSKQYYGARIYSTLTLSVDDVSISRSVKEVKQVGDCHLKGSPLAFVKARIKGRINSFEKKIKQLERLQRDKKSLEQVLEDISK